MEEPTAKTSLTQVHRRHLTDEDAQMICVLHHVHGHGLAELATRMEASEKTIRRILAGETFREATTEYRRFTRPDYRRRPTL